MNDFKYLKLLSTKFPTVEAAASEIINLSAIRSLPKGTEYFFSDLHGEHEAFIHLLRSASGMIKTKIDLVFDKTLTEDAREELAKLIYYPELYLKKLNDENKLNDEWRRITIYQLEQVCEKISAKYTRKRIRKCMTEDFRYVFDELLNVTDDINKEYYFNEVIRSIISTGIADGFICEMCNLIQRIAIDQVHIIGDIFDRGPRPDIIMDELMKFGAVDFQWGNHDISWMGAACGNKALIATVIRVSMAYNNFDLLEDGYGINLRALSEFADNVYENDDCKRFYPKILDENLYDPVSSRMVAKMHKAITIIQLKLEGQMIERHPEYNMNNRNFLKHINYDNMTVDINGVTYELSDKNLPTVDRGNPLQLTDKEDELMEVLSASFKHSKTLQKHIKFIFANGSMYKKVNDNLMYHGCIPFDDNGEFTKVQIGDSFFSGKAYLDEINKNVNRACLIDADNKDAIDFMWYLWCGDKSPLFGKDKMATFESYFLNEPELIKEKYNIYYQLSHKAEICDKIMEEFDVDKTKGHIINGHVPVKNKDGESPIKANGKLFIIDGGISKAYQSTTGIAGYTLIYDSHALRLAEHSPFNPHGKNTPKVYTVEPKDKRVNMSDTDKGRMLAEEIADLQALMAAYRQGII